MRCKSWMSLWAAVSVALSAGCQSPYMYYPYGPSGYPGAYTVPPAGQPPGGSLGNPVQPRTVPSQPGSSGQQPRTFGQPSQPSSPNQPETNNGSQGSSSGDSAKAGGSGQSGDANAVPDYEDPNTLQEQSSQKKDSSQETSSRGDLPDGSPFVVRKPSPTESGPPSAPAAKQNAGQEKLSRQDAFVPPVQVDPTSPVRTVAAAQKTESRKIPDPYGYDAENYRWLRGQVDYDERADSWNIIYDLTPEETDEYGGSLTLSDHQKLENLHEDDVVLVEGRVDSASPDRRGKPSYRVEHLARLIPEADAAAVAGK